MQGTLPFDSIKKSSLIALGYAPTNTESEYTEQICWLRELQEETELTFTSPVPQFNLIDWIDTQKICLGIHIRRWSIPYPDLLHDTNAGPRRGKSVNLDRGRVCFNETSSTHLA